MATFTPDTIRDLKVYLEGQGAVISIARSCDPNSTREFRGYHLSRDQIMQGEGKCPGEGKDDYSIQTARDKAGLSDARAAIDIQFKPAKLQDYSKWLLKQAQSNAPGTQDWRELIYSPDGVKVLRWDRERGVNSAPQPNEAALSHRTHTHVSFYRDSEDRVKVPTFSGYFGPAVPPPPGGDVTPEEVKALQTQLNAAGANPQLVVDGVYGPATKAAVVQVTTQKRVLETQNKALNTTVIQAKAKATEIVKL